MPVWVVTGNLGGGKSLVCVGKIDDYLKAGRRVATNLNIFVQHLFPWDCKKLYLVRIPDKPTVQDFEILGKGNNSPDESKNGLIVLDECGTWFNSRTFGDKERQPLIDWCLHSRKLGWDVMFIVQDVNIIDKQVRLAIAEHTVFCRRLDRLNIPVIGTLFSFFGERLPLPRIHLGIVRYGTNDRAIIVDRWFYRGDGYFPCYDTRQKFTDFYNTPSTVNAFGDPSGGHKIGCYSYLPPWHLHGWRRVKMDWMNNMRMTKIYWKRFRSPAAFVVGAGLVICFNVFTSTAGDVPDLEPKKETEDLKIEAPTLNEIKIISFSMLPDSAPRATFQSGDKLITSEELYKDGYSLSFSSTGSVVIKKGEFHVTARR